MLVSSCNPTISCGSKSLYHGFQIVLILLLLWLHCKTQMNLFEFTNVVAVNGEVLLSYVLRRDYWSNKKEEKEREEIQVNNTSMWLEVWLNHKWFPSKPLNRMTSNLDGCWNIMTYWLLDQDKFPISSSSRRLIFWGLIFLWILNGLLTTTPLTGVRPNHYLSYKCHWIRLMIC